MTRRLSLQLGVRAFAIVDALIVAGLIVLIASSDLFS
jgi:hypothetical protein